MKTIDIPKTRIARDKILSWIREGKLTSGERLPSERELARVLGMNHQTIRKSLAELEQAGLIERKHRIGSFLREALPVELTKGIALILPEFMLTGNQILQHPLTNLYLRGVLSELDQKKYSLTVLSYKPGNFWVDVGEILKIRKIKGVILHPCVDVEIDEVRKMLDEEIKIVLLHQEPKLLSLNLPYFSVDEQVPMAQILEKFIELGHRHIAVCLYKLALQNALKKEFLESFVNRYNLGAIEDIIVEIPNEAGIVDFSVLDNIFERRVLPTAVLVYDEFCASHIFKISYKRNIRIPEELSIAALCDNTPDFHPVSLTAPDTVIQNVEVAKMATRVLIKFMDNEDIAEREIKLKCNMLWKDSISECKGKLSR